MTRAAERDREGAPRLLLIRHARTVPVPTLESRAWPLAAGVERDIVRLAQRLAGPLGAPPVDRIVTSVEAKAVGTGEVLAGVWRVPCGCAPDLHEHDRRGLPPLDRDAWLATMRDVFGRPGERVLGHESADEARARLERGIAAAVAAHPAERLALVGHGTVLALLLARANRLDPFALWRSLRMPDAFVVDLATFEIRERPLP